MDLARDDVAFAGDLALTLERVFVVIRRLATYGAVSLPAAAVLGRLLRDGPHRLTALAAAEGVSQPGMTQLVGRLERHGLVRRGPTNGDRRVVLIQLTAAGQALIERRRAERADALSRLLDQLDPASHEAIQA